MFDSRDISYYIISLGCSKNLVDSERLNGAFMAAGFLPAEGSDTADIIIINTCGFITPAKRESIDVIFDALAVIEGSAVRRNLKKLASGARTMKRDFGKRIAVAGCLSQRYSEDIKKEIPELDFVYGIPDENMVPKLCHAFGISSLGDGGGRVPILPGLSYSYIKISDGCSNFCSYCTIPLIRGELRSFPMEMIASDVRNALSYGAVEMDIVAQDIASYRCGEYGLVRLVDEISRIEGVRWIRLLYCHPDHIGPEIIGLLAENERVVRYIDIPFQHASVQILRSMGRAGDSDAYLSLVEMLRERVPGIRIRSSFMVGYPGETEKDFRELCDFLESARIDRAGAFIFSPEEGTRASCMQNQVPERAKRERYRALMKLQQGISAKSLEGMVGSAVDVLVEERLDDATFIGRCEFDAPEVDGIFYLTAPDAGIKSIVRSRVTGSTEYDLTGEPE